MVTFLFSLFGVLLIAMFIIYKEKKHEWAATWAIVFGIMYGSLSTYLIQEQRCFNLDAYRGKTTLEITYRDSVAVDSVVVYKMK